MLIKFDFFQRQKCNFFLIFSKNLEILVPAGTRGFWFRVSGLVGFGFFLETRVRVLSGIDKTRRVFGFSGTRLSPSTYVITDEAMYVSR